MEGCPDPGVATGPSERETVREGYTMVEAEAGMYVCVRERGERGRENVEGTH